MGLSKGDTAPINNSLSRKFYPFLGIVLFIVNHLKEDKRRNSDPIL